MFPSYFFPYVLRRELFADAKGNFSPATYLDLVSSFRRRGREKSLGVAEFNGRKLRF